MSTSSCDNMLCCTACAVLLLLILLGWRQRKCWQLIWQLNGWRGVVQQPLLWLLLLAFLEPKSILETTRRVRKYFRRPLAIIVGTRVLLYVDDPSTMERILNAPECLDKTFLQEGFFARRGLLHAKAQKWKIRRKQLNPAFSQSILLSFLHTFNSVGNQLQEKFAQDLQGNAVKFKDVEDLLSRAVLEVSCQTTMGTETNFTQNDAEDIARTYKTLLEISAMKIVKPWLQIDILFRLLDRKNYECSVRSNKLVGQFVNNIVQRKHSEWQARRTASIGTATPTHVGNGNDHDNDENDDVALSDTIGNESQNIAPHKRIFIEQIFHLAASGDLTLQDIMDESHSMVLVSFETVSNSIIIALLCLAANTDCQDKLRHEIRQTFPNGRTEEITPEQLQQMKYLEMILNESLRLLTTVPMNLRHVSRDFQLHRQVATQSQVVLVPRNTIVVLDTFNMQRDAQHWGPYSQQFHPEHFSAEKAEKRHPYSFLPFSKGLRWCIGVRYSVFLTKILLVKLISSFEFRTETKLEHLRFIEGISLKFQNSDSITFQIWKINPNKN